ncbi:UDP-N-acetylmuramate dehydrogenase [Candidatus Kuenenbacteria bacterium]|nr:UDP-N-acetylmuramate dehydrogenase [Candidatus Kuenenbacteria bacterium]
MTFDKINPTPRVTTHNTPLHLHSKKGDFIGCGVKNIQTNIPLAPYTTFKIGGPAKYFYCAKNIKDLIKIIKIARRKKIPFFILGCGSNILISDEGFNGLVIKNLILGVRVVRSLKQNINFKQVVDAHYFPAHPNQYLQFSDLDYQTEPFDTEVEVSAGMPLQSFIQWIFQNKLTGLQWFAGIPGSIGGAIICNIHGGSKLFADYISEIIVLDKNNRIKKIKKNDIKFDYDFSSLKKEKLIILKARIFLSHGDIKRAKFVYQEWFKRKIKIQPQTNCPGSIFKNFFLKTAKKINAPTSSAGYFIDQCGLKGKKIGKAIVSKNHANFIINTGQATAKDVIILISLIKQKVRDKFNIQLQEEIQYIGF